MEDKKFFGAVQWHPEFVSKPIEFAELLRILRFWLPKEKIIEIKSKEDNGTSKVIDSKAAIITE